MSLGFVTKMRWRTYKDLLNNVTSDLRYEKGVEQEYNQNSRIPDLYVVKIKFNNNKIYSFYINDRIQVVDLFKKLIELRHVTIDEIDDTYLQIENSQTKFELYDTIKFELKEFDKPLNLVVKKRENQNNLIQIFVKALVGDLMTFEVQPTDTIQRIKCQIFLRYSFPIQQQQLLFSGKTLEDTSALANAQIKNVDTLHLCLLNK